MFKLDSPLMNFLNKVADVIILNILFMVFSIPVITVGASFSAAYYMAFKMVKDEESYIIRGFWKAFKENFVQATIIWLLMIAAVVVIILDYRIILYSGIEFARWIRISIIVVTVALLLGMEFVFPMQARFINTVKNTIKNSFLMAFSHLPTSILLVAAYVVPVVVWYFIPQSLPLLIVLYFGAVIYVKAFMLLRVFKKYEDAIAEGQDAEASEENPDEGIFSESERMEQGGEDGRMDNPDKVFQNGRFVEISDANAGTDTGENVNGQ